MTTIKLDTVKDYYTEDKLPLEYLGEYDLFDHKITAHGDVGKPLFLAREVLDLLGYRGDSNTKTILGTHLLWTEYDMFDRSTDDKRQAYFITELGVKHLIDGGNKSMCKNMQSLWLESCPKGLELTCCDEVESEGDKDMRVDEVTECKFKIGDKVRIVSNLGEMLNRCDPNGESCREYDLIDDMIQYEGKIATVLELYDCDARYLLDVDDDDWLWDERLLTPASDSMEDDLKPCSEQNKTLEYSGIEIMQMIKDGELSDGDVYSMLSDVGARKLYDNVDFIVGGFDEPSFYQLMNNNFKIINRKKYMELSVALRKLVENEKGIRYRDWGEDSFTMNIQSILNYVCGHEDSDKMLNDKCWEVDGIGWK